MQQMDLQTAYRECTAVTEARAANFKHAFAFLPRDRRRAIEVVYAFSRRCDDLSDGEAPTVVKREALDRIRADLHAMPRSDAVMAALGDVIARYHIPLELFDELIDGVVQDLDVHRYETFEDLSLYCYRVASTIGLICLEIFGYEDPDARGHARDLGIAMQLTNIIRDVKEDGEQGRIYIPQEDLRRFSLTEENLSGGGPASDVEPLILFEIDRARSFFERGLGLLPYLPRRSRSCPAVLAAIYGRLLGMIEADPARVLRGRVCLTSAVKKRIALGALFRSFV